MLRPLHSPLASSFAQTGPPACRQSNVEMTEPVQYLHAHSLDSRLTKQLSETMIFKFPRRSRSATPATSAPLRIDMPHITAELCAKVVAEPGLLGDLTQEATLHLRSILPPVWQQRTEPELRYLVAAAVAHNLKPYGTGSLPELQSMLQASTLDCSNYGLLTHHLSALLVPEVDRLRLAFVGWDGGVVGNHQMMIASSPRQMFDLALDPTLGLAFLATFDQIASGCPLAPGSILAINATAQLDASRAHFVRALLDGAFRPSDLLYYFDGVDHLLTRYGNPQDWPTPGAIAMRRRNEGVGAQ